MGTARSEIRLRITEVLDIDLGSERWVCNRCDQDLGDARRNYKESCLLRARDPQEIHEIFDGDPTFSYTPDRDWCSIVEIYCPRCGVLMDTEYLPPGHPITHDVELDLEALQNRGHD